LKVIFFGSTEFSLTIAQRIKEQFELIALITSKPKPSGRGLNLRNSAIIQWAQANGITTFTPDEPNNDAFVDILKGLEPEIAVLAAYSYILNKKILNIPKYHSINIHPSILPKYRGAAPIQRAIMAGEQKTGITIFFMDEKVDHGEIILQREVIITPEDTYGSLQERLADIGAEVTVDALRLIEVGNYKTWKQPSQGVIYAPKIKKEELIIKWDDKTENIFNLIRALSPRPGARTTFRNTQIIILKARQSQKKVRPSEIYTEDKNLYVGTQDGSLILEELTPAGRSRISGADFINGFQPKPGEMMI